ncbi:TraB/GumN family protein [Aquibacillus rhizosphaerae]|uniref:TraB/GumN family protein n=1 Tax=Aquibacillus rhizosphaerae TaxID=3051431 RepID=A0ABT7KZM4_9BACI|nr:TraB/GumN family protein [Aquibacillus sp. LR5S19]MDL4838918.1 TraB/GumN family protein [Aquibacillus sp. LR5S19]
MNRLKVSMMLIVSTFIMVACQSGEPVTFSDPNLEAAIRAELDQAEGDITQEDLDGITELNLSRLGIKELDGLGTMDELEVLSLQDNKISDFTVLEDLDSIQEINVSGNAFQQDDEQVALLESLSEQGIEVIQTREVAAVGSKDGPGGFLWKVADEDTTIYLQGTIHIGTEEFYPLHEKIEQAYAESDVVVPEIDLNNVDQMEMQKLNMELGTYLDGSTIEDHVSEELYTDLTATLEEFEVPIEMVETYKPWILSSTIQQLMIQQLGYIEGVDQYFLNRAAEDGKEVIGLETVEDQLRIMADRSPAFQAELLQESLVETEEFGEDIGELISIYKQGDPDKLVEVLMEEEGAPEESPEAKVYMEELNDNRNYKMADKVVDFLEEDDRTFFVIVGSLHLTQEPHIRSILEEEGYEVEHVH